MPESYQATINHKPLNLINRHGNQESSVDKYGYVFDRLLKADQ